MFAPNIQADFSIEESLRELDRLKYRIERFLIMPKHEEWLRREAFVRTAYSSTMIENPEITAEELEEAVKGSSGSTVPQERPEIVNYRRALQFVDFVSDTDIPVDEALIRHIHWFLMRGLNDNKYFPGSYRTAPNWIEDRGIRVYESPFHLDVPILMREFSLWLRADTPEINPVLKAGIAHARLVAIHPFVDGNGRSGRLLATLLLQRYGYGFRKLLSLDSYYQRHRDEYIEALNKSLTSKFIQECDFTPWLRCFTESIIIQGKVLEGQLTEWRIKIDKLHRELKPLGLSDRQIDGLIYAVNKGQISRKDYMEITGVSPLTATRDLKVLREKGLLNQIGIGRSRRYLIKERVQAGA